MWHMEEQVFVGNGIEIVKREGKYYLKYDAGEICDRIKQIQITDAEMKLAQKSSIDAYNVIIQYQNKGIYGEDA